jgi:hypothetical protein
MGAIRALGIEEACLNRQASFFSMKLDGAPADENTNRECRVVASAGRASTDTVYCIE